MFRNIYNKIKAYFRRTENYSPLRIIGEFALIDILSRYIIAFLILITVILYLITALVINPKFDVNSFRIPDFEQEVVKEIKKEKVISIINVVDLAILTPLIETLLFQIIPIWLISRFTKRRKIMVLFSAVLFAVAHENPFLFLFLMPSGVLFAWSYIVIRKRSRLKAYLTTASIHSLFNLSSLILIAVFK